MTVINKRLLAWTKRSHRHIIIITMNIHVQSHIVTLHWSAAYHKCKLSTTTNLIETLTAWTLAIQNRHSVTVAYRFTELIIIIIILAYLYCAAYTRMTVNESSPPCEQRRITFNDDGQRVQLARPELPAPHYICMHRMLPTTLPSPSRHYSPLTYCRYQFTDPERMGSLVR